MQVAGLLPYESVLVADLNNGSRLETYVIPGQPNSREVVIMGAAARQIKPKDIVIILGFGFLRPKKQKSINPKLLFLVKIIK
jgi:aspartate 1-decarboxylase